MRRDNALAIWFGRALFVSLSLFAIVGAKIPLGLPADAPIVPDIFCGLVVAWVIRSPHTATLPLIVAMALMADVLLGRPLGLGALMTVLVSEYFRAQRFNLREQMFVVEWLIFVILFAGSIGVQIAVIAATFADAPPVPIALNYIFVTALAYPFIVGVLHWVFLIRAPRSEDGPIIGGRTR